MPTKGALASSTTDYEQYGYDPNGNQTSFRNRAGQTIQFSYDALNRMTWKLLSALGEKNTKYDYDLLGRMIMAGQKLSFTYDALDRRLSETNDHGTFSSAWDLGGRRTRITHPSGFYVDQEYLLTGEMTRIRENGATSGIGVLATFGYDDLGRRTSLVRGNGTSTSYAYDPASRLAQMSHDMAGTGYDLDLTFAYNPAGQITQNTRANDLYAWTEHGSGATGSPANGLNQLASYDGVELATRHDAKGNLTKDPKTGYSFTYSAENLLISANDGVSTGTLKYDALMRLSEAGTSTPRQFAYDGHDRVAEYSSTGSPILRHVFGPGVDEPLVEYRNGYTPLRRFFHADERGSIVAMSDESGAVVGVNRYDEHGKPAAGNIGRFGFAGQPYETVSGLYYSRARMYNPRTGGRFMQPDPIGYGDGPNMYARTKGDPVNRRDPSGLSERCITGRLDGSTTEGPGGEIIVTSGPEVTTCFDNSPTPGPGWANPFDSGGEGVVEKPIIIVGKRLPRLRYESVIDFNDVLTYRSFDIPPGYELVPGSNNTYMRRGDGRIELTPYYKTKVCENYNRMMDSNNEIAAGSYLFGLFGIKFKIPGPAVIMDAIVGGVTTILSFAPPPEGCNTN